MHPSPTTPCPARPGAPRILLGAVAAPRLRLAVEVLVLTLFVALLSPRHLARAWRHAWAPLPTDLAGYDFEPADSRAPFRVRSIHDGTHLVCEHPLLYAIGPGPNLGLRPLPRTLPPPRARIARAPPRPKPRPNRPIRAKSLLTRGRARTPAWPPSAHRLASAGNQSGPLA